MSGDSIEVPLLQLQSTIGFNGAVPGGLMVHPDGQHLVYPLGCNVMIENLKDRTQTFLSGHTNDVSCLAVSNSGRFLASGQRNYMGFLADIIVWDYENRVKYCQLSLHKVRVEALAFSHNDKYLISLGGQDDGSVVVWNMATKDSICGASAQAMSAGTTYCLTVANMSDDLFVTGGDNTLRVWKLDVTNRKITPTDVSMGQLKRIVKCIEMGDDDEYFYCGTTTGDIIAINTRTTLFQFVGPEKDRFSRGVLSICLLKNNEILVGAGDGTLAIVKSTSKNKILRTANHKKLMGAVTSIALRGKGHQFFVGTDKCDLYRFNYSEFEHELISTCHSSPIKDIVFPANCSDLFVTCSYEEIRVWLSKSRKERLRITIPNMTCNAIHVTSDGQTILSAWDDGKIRAFYPETGKAKYTITDAHNSGVTAITCTSDCQRIISGGGEGQVRVWQVKKSENRKGPTHIFTLLDAMKEHKGEVSAIRLRKNDMSCVSASYDGTCIIWDLTKFVRNQIIFANTQFRCVQYHPDEFQVITSGTDRKLSYWEVCDGASIRDLDGAKSGAVNAMDITADGRHFVTGGDDKLLKLFAYDEGEVTHIGIGHSTHIQSLKISPDSKFIISVSKDGGILRWGFPYQ